MAGIIGPNVAIDNLIMCVDLSSRLSSPQANLCQYRWFTTDGSNPTTKSGFDAFFTGTPAGTGNHEGEINWTTLPSYITQSTSFAWEVSGSIFIEKAGLYEFALQSDDGNELQINNEIVASFYGGRGVGAYDYSSALNLKKGWIPFQYRMQQGAGGHGARVYWKKPGESSFSIIPGTYYAGRRLMDVSGANNHLDIYGAFPNTLAQSITLNGTDNYLGNTDRNWLPAELTVSMVVSDFTTGYVASSLRYSNPDHDGWFLSSGGATTYHNQYSNYSLTWDTTLSSTTMITYSHSTSQSRVFVNGVLVNSNVLTQGWQNTLNRVEFGRYDYQANNYSNAKVYSINIWDRELTEVEVKRNFQSIRDRYSI